LYLCSVKERINWIDWAKSFAIFTVVFCHLPQSQEWFYYRYLQATIIVVFFFLSGYLKKDRGSAKRNWRKYWYGLILPYIIYNLAVYPYWFLKYYIINGEIPDFFHALRPFIGALLFEHNNCFAEPLNGSLWYLPAILIMHITVDLCRKTRHQHMILISLCVISFFLYAANKYWYFAPDLTPMGLIRNFPYYYIGYIMGEKKLFRDTNIKTGVAGCVLCVMASILLFSWHLKAFFGGQYILHIVLFYPVNITFLFGILWGCKLLNRFSYTAITHLSTGTLVVLGLHAIVITSVNYTVDSFFNVSNTLCYQWYEALPITLFIIIILYPVIAWGTKHAPILLGKSPFQKEFST